MTVMTPERQEKAVEMTNSQENQPYLYPQQPGQPSQPAQLGQPAAAYPSPAFPGNQPQPPKKPQGTT
ncbi:hypothetical protein, partial [Bifidobacterium sp.]